MTGYDLERSAAQELAALLRAASRLPPRKLRILMAAVRSAAKRTDA